MSTPGECRRHKLMGGRQPGAKHIQQHVEDRPAALPHDNSLCLKILLDNFAVSLYDICIVIS
jgi:hypothetical protein